MNLREWEARWDHQSERMVEYYRRTPQARAEQRVRALARQARGEFRYRKWLAADIERCKALYLAGVPLPELMHKTRMCRSTVFRFCKGLRRNGIRRNWVTK